MFSSTTQAARVLFWLLLATNLAHAETRPSDAARGTSGSEIQFHEVRAKAAVSEEGLTIVISRSDLARLMDRRDRELKQPSPARKRRRMETIKRGDSVFEVRRSRTNSAPDAPTLTVSVKIGGKATPTHVLVDGELKTTPAQYKLRPGVHRIMPRAGSERQQHVDLSLTAGETINVVISVPSH